MATKGNSENKYKIISTSGIEGFGESYLHTSGEKRRMVYLYNNEDESGCLQVTYVPDNEVTDEVLSNPEEYDLVTFLEGTTKILKIVSRAVGINVSYS